MRNSGTPISKLPHKLQTQVAAALYSKPTASGSALVILPPAGVREVPARPVNNRYPLVLWLDYRVPSLNSLLGKNRFVIKRFKDQARGALAATLGTFPGWPQNPPGRMHVLITCYVIQPRDADNPCPKFVIDELRHAGILRADDPTAMFLTVNPEVKVSKRKLEGTRITVCEALP